MIKRFKKGLTLIELVVTIAVVAILTGAAVGTYFGVTESSKHSRAETEALTFFSEVQNSVVVSKEYNQYKVSLSTKDGLIFSRYSPETIEDFVEQVSAVEHRYNAVIGSTVQAIKQVEPQEKPTVYFFNTYYRNDGDVAEIEYFGYVPSGFAGSYVKVVDFKSGTIVNDPQFTTVPYHTPAEWVEPEPEPEPTVPTGTKIIKNLYLYAPNFNNGKVGITQKYKKDGVTSHYESRNFDYEIDRVSPTKNEHTYRFLFTYIYGYENYVQFAALNDDGSFIPGTQTNPILVEDFHINGSMRYMNVPGIYDWQDFFIDDYKDYFDYFVVGTINGEDQSDSRGRNGLSYRKSTVTGEYEYAIEELYLKEGDKILIKSKSGTTFNYDDLDVEDRNFIDEEDKFLKIKDGYAGKYSFYLKPESGRIYASAHIPNLSFDKNLVEFIDCKETGGNHLISEIEREPDSSTSLGGNNVIKAEFRLGATGNYKSPANMISGKLTISITGDPSEQEKLNKLKGRIQTTNSIYYNVDKSDDDPHWKNPLDGKTIGNNLSISGSSTTFDITVFSSAYHPNSFKHKIELSLNDTLTKPYKIQIKWDADPVENALTLGYGINDQSETWSTENTEYTLKKNIYHTPGQVWIHSEKDSDNFKHNGKNSVYMYLIENIKFDIDTYVKVRYYNGSKYDFINPGSNAFSGNGTGSKAEIRGDTNNFLLKAGTTYQIYCFAVDNGNGTYAYIASEAHKM